MTATPGLFVIVVDDLVSKRVYGPYATSAAAAGAAFTAFGPNEFGNPARWRVTSLEDLRGGGA